MQFNQLLLPTTICRAKFKLALIFMQVTLHVTPPSGHDMAVPRDKGKGYCVVRALGFFLYAIVITALPVAVVLWNMGSMAPFWFLAGDAYLYLGIGEASSGLSMSFDGLRATNGFHPLWQIWVRIAVSVTDTPLQAMNLVAYSAIALTLGGVLVLGAAIRRFTDSWLLAMLAVPGVYYLTIGQALHNMPVWGFFDGMEVGLAFFLASCLVWLISTVPARAADTTISKNRSHTRVWQLIGFTLAALVLTRLDEVFVPMCMALAILFWPGELGTQRWSRAAWLAIPTMVALLAFVGWSLLTTGMLTPVSGSAKGEGALVANVWVTLATFFAPLIDLREALTSYEAGREALLGGAFRVVQLLVPAVFALGFVVVVFKRYRTAAWAPLLAGICFGILVKALYNIAFVNYWHQASWYFAVAMMMMTLGTAIMLAPVIKRLNASRAALIALVLVVVGVLHASLWSAGLMTDHLRPAQRDFWRAGPAMQAELLAADPDLRVLEFGDGMLNFTFDFPIRHGFVFAGDAQSLASLHAGRLLRVSYADGFNVMSSYEYLRVPPGAEDWTSDQIRAFLQNSFLDQRVKAELPYFTYSMMAVQRPSGVPFIRLQLLP